MPRAPHQGVCAEAVAATGLGVSAPREQQRRAEKEHRNR
jgi:hypothetical protein